MNFSFQEILVILAIVFLMAMECWRSIRAKTWVEVYKPTLFVTIILVFYALFGPLRAIFSTGEVPNFIGSSGTFYRNYDHRDVLIYGWTACLVFYSSFLLGFYLFKAKVKLPERALNVNLRKARTWGEILCIIALLSHILFKVQELIFSQQYSNFLNLFSLPSHFRNYVSLMGDLFIPGVILQFCVWLRKREKTLSLLAWLSLSLFIFINQGVRYKLLLLMAPLFLLWLFYLKRRPKIVLGVISMVLFIILSGIISVWRTENRGGHLKLQDFTPLQIATSSFDEAGTFFTSSLVLSLVPSKQPFLGVEPIITTFLQPIPRSLLPNKPSGDYSYRIQDEIYTIGWTRKKERGLHSHTAFLSFVEYYLIAGWPSLVLISFGLGFITRRLWSWFLLRQYEPVAQSIYLLNACFLYSALSRGYFPQVFMAYCTFILPLYFVYRRLIARKS